MASDDKRNKIYALAGVALLREVPDLCNNKSRMWRIVREMWRIMRAEAEQMKTPKNHNNQMDVVVALWKNRDIRHRA